MFIRFDSIHERNRQTDGRTDRHCTTAWAALVHSIVALPHDHRAAIIE